MKERVRTDTRFIAGIAAIAAAALLSSLPAFEAGRGGELLHNLATPSSGEKEVLQPEVQKILHYLRSNGIRSFAISPAIAGNRFIAQPLTEGAYPITVHESSDTLVSHTSEPLPPGCSGVDLEIGKGIRIAACR